MDNSPTNAEDGTSPSTPGSLPPASPGSQATPTSLTPRSLTPGSLTPGSLTPRSLTPHRSLPPLPPPGPRQGGPVSAWTPTSLAPLSLPPTSWTPSTLPPGTLPPTPWTPASLPPGTMPPGYSSFVGASYLSMAPGPLGTPGVGSTAAPRPADVPVPRPWLLPLVALATALVLGITAGVVWASTRTKEPVGGPAAAVVRNWANAIAAGRASEALALSATLPDGDRSLLTDEVLKAVHETHPITDVQVAPRDDVSATLTWKVAGQVVSQVVPVTAGEDRQVARAAAQVSFASLNKATPVRIAGRPATAPTILLFPGAYPIASTSPNITYGDGLLRVTVDQPRVDTAGLVPTATRTGQETFTAVLNAALGDCLKQKVLVPPGCPFAYTASEGEAIDPASVAWSMPNGLGDLAAPDVTDPTRARLEHRTVVVLTASTTKGPIRKEVPVTLRPVMNLTLTKPALAWG